MILGAGKGVLAVNSKSVPLGYSSEFNASTNGYIFNARHPLRAASRTLRRFSFGGRLDSHNTTAPT